MKSVIAILVFTALTGCKTLQQNIPMSELASDLADMQETIEQATPPQKAKPSIPIEDLFLMCTQLGTFTLTVQLDELTYFVFDCQPSRMYTEKDKNKALYGNPA